jgi:uncharacterized membrane protein (UPF0127 family)
VRDDRVLASAEVAVGRLAKARGLLGRSGIEGALVLEGRHSVHSFRMAFDLDVAFLQRDGTVIKTLRLRRNRVTLPVWHARWIVEAEAGAFAAWELKVGDVIDIRTVGDLPPAGRPGRSRSADRLPDDRGAGDSRINDRDTDSQSDDGHTDLQSDDGHADSQSGDGQSGGR